MTRLAPMVEQNELRVYVPPGDIYYRDRLVNCAPVCARIMRWLLVRYPLLASLNELLGEAGSIGSFATQLTRLRRALEACGVPVSIVNYRARGYRLEWRNQ